MALVTSNAEGRRCFGPDGIDTLETGMRNFSLRLYALVLGEAAAGAPCKRVADGHGAIMLTRRERTGLDGI